MMISQKVIKKDAAVSREAWDRWTFYEAIDHKLPLVEGTPRTFSSFATAWRKARPNALKRDSTM
jgi:hypothetical protein